jgi:signal transduction histidine kinase
VNLPELVSEILTLFIPLAAQKGMSLRDTVPSDAVVSSDRELIRLVLQNLVGNAVKYSQKGTVTVSAVKREDKQGGWVVSVSDEGPGIAAEHQDHIFEAFRRGEVYGQRGIGLGLAIASRAAKLLGAELTVESKLGIGSAFNLVLLQPRTIA